MKSFFRRVIVIAMEEKFYKWDIDFPIFVKRENAQQLTPLHTHHFVELVCVFNGRGKHILMNETVELKRGDIFVIPRGMAHGYEPYPDETFSLFNLLFIPEKLPMPQLDLYQFPGFRRLFTPGADKNAEYPHFSVSDDEINSISTLLNEILRESEFIRPATKTYRIALMMQLMCRLSRIYSGENFSSGSDVNKQAVIMIQEYLKKHFKEDFPVNELAKKANMSQSNFLKYFRIVTGLSPLQYVLNLRLNHACRKLITTKDSVTGIAFDVGFSDSNYFARIFHKHIGITPRQYRKRYTDFSGAGQ